MGNFGTSHRVVSALGTILTAASCSSSTSEGQTPTQTPPYLSALAPDPLHILLVPRMSTDAATLLPTFAPIPIAFNVVSEDLGDDLEATVVLDYPGSAGTGGVIVGPRTSIPAGRLGDPPRHAETSFTLPAGTAAGCHSVTLVVTHAFVPLELTPAQPGDVAYAVWWLDADDDVAAPSATMARCFGPSANGSDSGR